MIGTIWNVASPAALTNSTRFAETATETSNGAAPVADGRFAGATTAERLAARQPAHTPEWTDFNEGDPGPTTMELLAWPLDLALHGPGPVAANRAVQHGRGVASGLAADGRQEGSPRIALDAGLALDSSGNTVTQDDIDNGRLIGKAGSAPLRPAEFVLIRFGHKMGDDD